LPHPVLVIVDMWCTQFHRCILFFASFDLFHLAIVSEICKDSLDRVLEKCTFGNLEMSYRACSVLCRKPAEKLNCDWTV